MNAPGDLLSRPKTQTVLLLALASLWIFARLGQGHLANYDDCYYAEKAKEMVRDGHWLTPHFAGVPRWDNPPLFLWLMALSFSLFGVTDYGAVFFSALSGVLCVLLILRIADRLRLDAFERWTAAFVLLTTQYFLKYARHAMFDVFLTLLFLLAIEAYIRAFSGDRKRFLHVGLYCGLGVLTKSVLGFFPMAIAALHLIVGGRARVVVGRWFLLGLGVAVLTAAPWYLYSYRVHGDAFLEEHVRWLLWKRAFVIGRDQHSWTTWFGYLKDLGVHYWPWLPFAIVGFAGEARRLFARGGRTGGDPEVATSGGWTRRGTAQLLLIWLLVVVGTMSLAIEKKLWYIMTAFPCLAILAAIGVGALIRSDAARRRAVTGGFAFLAVGAAILNLTPIGIRYERNPDLQRMALVASGTVPEGQTVLNLDLPYWDVANQFLYYSDRNLTLPLADADSVRKGLDRGGYALLSVKRYPEVSGGNAAAYPAIAASGRFVLVKAAPETPAVLPPEDRRR